MVKNLKNNFHPYSKEQQLYRIPKKNLKKNPKALKEFKKKYPKCIICNKPQHTHHKTTRGAGGADKENNLMPLCLKHHNELHTIGKKTFRKKYKFQIENWEGRKNE